MNNTSSSDTNNERTDVYYGTDTVLNKELQFFSNSKENIDTCMNYTRPQLAIEIDSIKKAFIDAKNRGVRFRYLTEITAENISFCKELMKIVGELRHLDGIKGNFMISESEYLAPMVLLEREKERASQIIRSNVKEIVEWQQHVFDSFWVKATPAQQRIMEIGEGGESIETKVLKDKEKIFNYLKSISENTYEQSTCCSIGGMQLVYNNFFDEYKKIVDRSRREKESKGVRWITSIDKDSIDLVKIFLNEGMQIRHIKNLTHMDFAVDNKNFNATIDKMEGGRIMESLLISNEPAYISHYNSIFEELWKVGVDAIERIKDIEQGVDLADIEVIPSSAKAQELYLDLVKDAKEEVLLMFPSTNAFIRQEKIGAVQSAKEAAKQRNVKVRILMPSHNLTEQSLQSLKQKENINVRSIEQMSETNATMLVVDRKASLVMEIRDDSKMNFIEAIGLSTYSNSKAGVLSYVAIFENMWKQTELYQQIKESNKQLELAIEQLKTHGKMQEEFINIASHELRTPTQAVLAYSELLRRHPEKKEDMIQAIYRNAERLQRLTDDILYVSRIESNTLKLNKEKFNLSDLLSNIIEDYRNNIEKNNSNVRLSYSESNKETFLVEADRERIIQVIYNLLNNAVKFTEEKKGEINVAAEEKEKDDREVVVVTMKDTGVGIDSEILPRLFTKFATRSQTGTGLGLFICKSIIEAHGGKIWAVNNANSKGGATFAFSLPISKQQEQQQPILSNNNKDK